MNIVRKAVRTDQSQRNERKKIKPCLKLRINYKMLKRK